MRRLFLGFAMILTACAGPATLVAGEAIRVPEPPPPLIDVLVLAGDDATPLPASVQIGTVDVQAGADGLATAIWPEAPTLVTVAHPGFSAVERTITELPEEMPLEITLDPVVLTGVVVQPGGQPLDGVTVTTAAERTAVTGGDGRFAISRAVPAEVTATRPAWMPATVDWDGTAELSITLEPRMIRALRVGGPISGDPVRWQEILELADATEINALVIDTKNEAGTVFHNTSVSTAHEISAVQVFYDLDQVLADMDAHGLYKITRIVTFQDSPMARANPEIAVWNVETDSAWRNNKGERWVDPTDRESWEYPLALAVEACERGFDEIQFDYVRFPSDGDIAVLYAEPAPGQRGPFDGVYDEENRVATITAFLQEAKSRLAPLGCAVAADIFAITLESTTDEGIGQDPAPFSYHADVLSPMIYTYTYGPGWKGFDNPNDHPVAIVGGALDGGIPKLEGSSIYRPWIQTWLLDADEMKAVQRTVEDREFGWMVWSANTIYVESMFEPAE